MNRTFWGLEFPHSLDRTPWNKLQHQMDSACDWSMVIQNWFVVLLAVVVELTIYQLLVHTRVH